MRHPATALESTRTSCLGTKHPSRADRPTTRAHAGGRLSHACGLALLHIVALAPPPAQSAPARVAAAAGAEDGSAAGARQGAAGWFASGFAAGFVVGAGSLVALGSPDHPAAFGLYLGAPVLLLTSSRAWRSDVPVPGVSAERARLGRAQSDSAAYRQAYDSAYVAAVHDRRANALWKGAVLGGVTSAASALGLIIALGSKT